MQAAEAAAGVLKDGAPPSAEKERGDELLRRAEAELRAAHANVIGAASFSSGSVGPRVWVRVLVSADALWSRDSMCMAAVMP